MILIPFSIAMVAALYEMYMSFRYEIRFDGKMRYLHPKKDQPNPWH